MKSPNWSNAELTSLFAFVDDDNAPECLKMWADESLKTDNPRSYNATQYQYYTRRKTWKAKAEAKNVVKKAEVVENKGAQYHKQWNEDDNRKLNMYVAEGRTVDQIADLLQRTPDGVETQYRRLQREKTKIQEKVTRTPISEYIAQHPELIPTPAPVEEQPTEEITFKDVVLLKGEVFRIPVNVRLEKTSKGYELVGYTN